ncbi:hypothetical protein GCM10023238_35080 [Streptomyces heliomycini]
MLRHHARTARGRAQQMAADTASAWRAADTCEGMARGGIPRPARRRLRAGSSVDRVLGGAAHFEKMLYDTRCCAGVRAHCGGHRSELARRVALETADFMVRELRTPRAVSRPRWTRQRRRHGRHVEGAY